MSNTYGHTAVFAPKFRAIVGDVPPCKLNFLQCFSGCSVPGVTDNVCDEATCTPGPEGYTCGEIKIPEERHSVASVVQVGPLHQDAACVGDIRRLSLNPARTFSNQTFFNRLCSKLF